MPRPTYSFEFFPPKSEKAEDHLWGVAQTLAALDPAFMTMTYGAGGSTKDGTFDSVTRIASMTGLPMAAHLTCATTPKSELSEYVDKLGAAGIRHIVALRGDLPKGEVWPKNDPEYFDYSNDFVRWLKDKGGIEVSVGTYPEKHPDAADLSRDIEALKMKQDAGADRAITQFFFDNDIFYTFLDAVRAAGVTIPVVPGLLPILNFESMCGFAGKCQASVPDWLHEKFDGLDDKPEEHRKVAIDLLRAQVADLAENGIPHLHFYTLNKGNFLVEVLRGFGA